MARGVYSLVLYGLVPLVLIRLFLRGLNNRHYWQRWPERFGWSLPDQAKTSPEGPRPIWIHSVSVGETQAAAPMVEQLLVDYPDVPVVITTTTPTGYERVRSLFGDRVSHLFAPYDLPHGVAAFLNHVRPRLGIIMETEIWPNLFSACARRAIPLMLVNARMSERSAAGYRKWPSLVKPTLENLNWIAAQSEADRQRLIGIGAPRDRVDVTGSIKFDVRMAASIHEEAEVQRRLWGVGRPVWIAASTHEGEEEQVLEAFAQVRNEVPDCLLVLVPRHPERFDRVANLVERREFSLMRRSQAVDQPLQGQPLQGQDVDVYLGDTMGELPTLMAASDVVFMGGSLVPVGGHNMLEPASLGLPVITGPNVFNFAGISALLLDHSAARMAADQYDLAVQAIALLTDANQRHELGENARVLVAQNRGALARLLEGVGRFV